MLGQCVSPSLYWDSIQVYLKQSRLHSQPTHTNTRILTKPTISSTGSYEETTPVKAHNPINQFLFGSSSIKKTSSSKKEEEMQILANVLMETINEKDEQIAGHKFANRKLVEELEKLQGRDES